MLGGNDVCYHKHKNRYPRKPTSVALELGSFPLYLEQKEIKVYVAEVLTRIGGAGPILELNGIVEYISGDRDIMLNQKFEVEDFTDGVHLRQVYLELFWRTYKHVEKT